MGSCKGEQLGGCDLWGSRLVMTSCVRHPAAAGEASASWERDLVWSAKSSNILANPTYCEAARASPWIWPV